MRRCEARPREMLDDLKRRAASSDLTNISEKSRIRLQSSVSCGGWDPETWPQVKAEFKKALALRSRIERAGWFN